MELHWGGAGKETPLNTTLHSVLGIAGMILHVLLPGPRHLNLETLAAGQQMRLALLAPPNSLPASLQHH